MAEGAFETFLMAHGVLAIFLVMLIKHLGAPVPVPSDIIMITAGVQAANGTLTLWEVLVAVEVAVLVGGTAQFWIIRRVGRQLLFRAGRFLGLTQERLDDVGARLKRRGALAVFIGLNIPIARAAVMPGAALAGLAYPPVAVAMISGTAIFYGWHMALGYLVGPSASDLLGRLDIPLWPVVLGLAALGLVAWLLLHRRRKAVAAPEDAVIARLHTWTEAACPGCLAATAIQRRTEVARQA
jgi:membrane protein DedA with SNARE-associated domain